MSDNRMSMGEAVVWALFCFPVGYIRMGQGMKWLVWMLICGFTGGLGVLPMWVDYFMCASKAQTSGSVGEWEWFPRV